jgi:HEAT repeat protein
VESLRHDLQQLIEDPAAYLDDDRVEIRRLAASLLGRAAATPAAAAALAKMAGSDPAAAVRAAAAAALASTDDPTPLLALAPDEAPEVREAIAYALGEIGHRGAVPWLSEAAGGDADDGVREGAVAALGAIGDDSCLPLLIELSSSAPPKVRRRAVVALSAFESAAALDAIKAARGDRNPMVKEVAEMVVGGGNAVDLPWPSSKPAAG